jgi:hypothetical protein
MTAPDLSQEVIEIEGRWVTRTYSGTATLSVAWGDDIAGEVGVGSADEALAWLAGALASSN